MSDEISLYSFIQQSVARFLDPLQQKPHVLLETVQPAVNALEETEGKLLDELHRALSIGDYSYRLADGKTVSIPSGVSGEDLRYSLRRLRAAMRTVRTSVTAQSGLTIGFLKTQESFQLLSLAAHYHPDSATPASAIIEGLKHLIKITTPAGAALLLLAVGGLVFASA